MRAVKHKALSLNVKKRKALTDLCQAYSREKHFWLCQFQSWELQSCLGRHRTIRDQMTKQKYRSPNGLQARHWKLALEDAAQTWDRYWEATFTKVRIKIASRKTLSETMRHYAHWLLKSYPAFASLMQGENPIPPFPIPEACRKQTANYVRRIVRQCKGKAPAAKKSRSVRFDADCYDSFEHKGRQYVTLMSLTPGKRILIPLSGKTAISGTITAVLSEEDICIHIPQELKQKHSPKITALEAVDFGYTEVMTDIQGIQYGKQFGKILTQESEHRHHKMRKRHKLHAIQKKKRASDPERASRLLRYNLGKQKQNSKAERCKATLEKEINTAINELVRTKRPAILVTEDLRHTFSYDKPKSVNRKFSSWLRGKLQDRVAFKALAEGFRHEQVNSAYGSQSCPFCEFVDDKNRKGDRFQCLHCRHEDMSDRIAAMNYARRMGDPEIGRYTPYREVKSILLNRFHRRLETGNP